MAAGMKPLLCSIVLLAACAPQPILPAHPPAHDDPVSPEPAPVSDPAPVPTPAPAPMAACDRPDALIVLDRTASMHKTPSGDDPPNTVAGRLTTKWGIAVTAINALVAAPVDSTVRFGLSLFPRDPGGSQCKSLQNLIGGSSPSNPSCQTGEVVVPTALGMGPAINGALSVETTKLCTSTPISQGVDTAAASLTATAAAGHKQFLVLITDGKETCGANPADAVARAAMAGVDTHVVGFGVDGDGVSVTALNAMACAGRTAIDFGTRCQLSGSVYVPVDMTSTVPLYHDAKDGVALKAALETVTNDFCCDCQIL
jgi:hypothetical protein